MEIFVIFDRNSLTLKFQIHSKLLKYNRARTVALKTKLNLLLVHVGVKLQKFLQQNGNIFRKQRYFSKVEILRRIELIDEFYLYTYFYP